MAGAAPVGFFQIIIALVVSPVHIQLLPFISDDNDNDNDNNINDLTAQDRCCLPQLKSTSSLNCRLTATQAVPDTRRTK
jgi:hypothetical protein